MSNFNSKNELLKQDHYVYRIRRPAETGDKRYYIGVTGPRKSKTRWEEHVQRSKRDSTRFLYCWMKKHPDCFYETIYGPISKEEAYELEGVLVPKTAKERKALGLVNEACGGNWAINNLPRTSKDKGIAAIKAAWGTEETKNKVRGEKHWSHRISKEEHPLAGLSGKSSNAYGYKHTQEQLSKRSGKNHPGYGKKAENCKTSKPVIATKIATGEIKRFPSALAAFHEGWATSHGNVINCCKKRKRYNTHNGCTWEYAT